MGNIIRCVSIMFLACFFIHCGNEDILETPTTGTVSGVVTFVGEPPKDIGTISVSIFSQLDEQGRPFGPPDRHSEPFKQFTGKVPYTISGVSYGTYKLAAVGYKASDAPVGSPQTILGMYGFNPPTDNTPDSFTVSKEQPDVKGIDIVANYSMIKKSQP